MIAEWDGRLSVVDFKTSNSAKKEEWIEKIILSKVRRMQRCLQNVLV